MPGCCGVWASVSMLRVPACCVFAAENAGLRLLCCLFGLKSVWLGCLVMHAECAVQAAYLILRNAGLGCVFAAKKCRVGHIDLKCVNCIPKCARNCILFINNNAGCPYLGTP